MGRAWTGVEDRCMREFYPHLTGKDMAKVLKRSERSVYMRANTLGLRKSAEFLASDRSGRARRGLHDERIKAAQFKPGLTPWNKGVKGSTGVQEACRRTQFKPGNKPQTWVPVGSFRICDGVLQQKMNDDPGPSQVRWHPVHRTVWEREHGPVPKGRIVRFKPGQQTIVLEQITLDRLECVSRAENARLNHPRNKSPELARLVQLKGAITRQVNRIAREAQEQRA